MKQLIIVNVIILFLNVSCNNGTGDSDAYGSFESIPVLVSAGSQGQLLSLSVQEGQHLAAGQPAGVIDTMAFHLQREQVSAAIRALDTRFGTLDAQVAVRKVKLDNLQRELSRVSSLLEDGAATEKQKDEIEGNVKLVKAELRSLESQKITLVAEKKTLIVQTKQVAERIWKAAIINPAEGVVLKKYKQEGEIVAAGQAIYKIASLDTMVLRAYISGKQLASVSIGQPVIVRFDGSEGIEELPGTIIWISSEAEFTPKIIQTREERVNLVYALKVEVANDGRLKIGMPGEVKF
ncbi:MAG: HlyD family efflux transporter periplasmic adaptor subunit [Bacteroidales bacterium]|nr:HlyD family efflux transporter periplasmic adaptor subunit [Bacteroidales bacterium]